MRITNRRALVTMLASLVAVPGAAQSFRVQCPATTALHPGTNVAATPNNGAVTEPAGIMDMGVLAGNAPVPLMAISP